MRRLFRFPWRSRDDIRRDMDAEFQFHLDARTDELVAAGMTRAEARTQALAEFGDVNDARQYIHQIDTGPNPCTGSSRPGIPATPHRLSW